MTVKSEEEHLSAGNLSERNLRVELQSVVNEEQLSWKNSCLNYHQNFKNTFPNIFITLLYNKNERIAVGKRSTQASSLEQRGKFDAPAKTYLKHIYL